MAALKAKMVDDLTAFDSIYDQSFSHQFPLPSIDSIVAAIDVSDKRDGKVVASGILKLFTEAVIVTDQQSPRTTRVKAVDLLMAYLIDWCVNNKIEQVHAFVSDQTFQRMLTSRYNFSPVSSSPLVFNVED